MKKLIIFLMIFTLLFVSIPSSVFAAFTKANVGPDTDFDGDVNVPSGKGYYINETLLAVGDITDALNVTMSNLGTTVIPEDLISDTADTDSLGTAAAEWQSLYIGTAGKIYLGLDQEVALEVTDANTLAITASSNVDFSGGLDVSGGIIVGSAITSDTTATDTLGSTSLEWLELYISDGGHVYLDSDQLTNIARNAANEITLTASAGVTTSAGLTVTGDLLPAAASTHSLGSATVEFADLYLDDSGYVYFGIGQDVHIQRTGANAATFTASGGVTTSAQLIATGGVTPAAADGASLGTADLEFGDIFLHDDSYIKFGAGQDVHLQRTGAGTATFTADTLTASADLTVTGTMGAATVTGEIRLITDNAQPDTTGEIMHDTTVEGYGEGALVWYDGDSVRTVVDLETLASDDDYVVAYDADADGFYMKEDATAAGNWVLHLMDVDAADTDYVISDATGDGDKIGSIAAMPDYARNITTTGDAEGAGTITITGTLADGTTGQTEEINLINGTTQGAKAFCNITAIVAASTGGTWDVGIGDIIGLPNAISAEADIYYKTVDGVAVFGEISGKGNTTNNTLDCATIVQNEDITIYYHN